MDTLAVQLGVKHGRVAQIARSDGEAITIGRALNNTLVLTDPYVAAHQIRFFRDGDSWFAQVLAGDNPVTMNDDLVTADEFPINSGDRITIGRTQLTLLDAAAPVDTTRKLILASSMLRGKLGVTIAFVVTTLVAFLDGFSDYFQVSTDDDWQQYLSASLMAALFLTLWAGVWALMGRLFRHQHQFSLQLLATTGVFLCLIFIAPMIGYVEFLTLEDQWTEMLYYLMALVAIAVLLRFNLFLATHIKRTWLIACALSLAIVGFAYLTSNLESSDFTVSPSYSQVLKPPFALRGEAEDVESYLTAVQKHTVIERPINKPDQ